LSTTTTVNNNNNDNKDLSLTKWEMQLLKCIKTKGMTEKKIAKQISLNGSVVSELITNLMLLGFVERFRKRRMHFSSREYFIATIDGIEALEAAKRSRRSNNGNNIFWAEITSLLKANIERTLLEFSEQSLAFRLTFGAAKSSYRIAKFILK
jgi:DNA-binding MarR family transcriptional regulator